MLSTLPAPGEPARLSRSFWLSSPNIPSIQNNVCQWKMCSILPVASFVRMGWTHAEVFFFFLYLAGRNMDIMCGTSRCGSCLTFLRSFVDTWWSGLTSSCRSYLISYSVLLFIYGAEFAKMDLDGCTQSSADVKSIEDYGLSGYRWKSGGKPRRKTSFLWTIWLYGHGQVMFQLHQISDLLDQSQARIFFVGRWIRLHKG